MSVMVLDAGNSIIKAKIARRENGEIAFPHAMKQHVVRLSKNVQQLSDHVQMNWQNFLLVNKEEHSKIQKRRC